MDKKKKTGGWYYRLGLTKKTALWGIIFLLPWLFGFLFFFLSPLIETITYGFNTVSLVEGGITKQFAGLANFKNAVTIDAVFNRLIITMVTATLPQVAIVIIFSLLSAIMLNGNFSGRSVARTIFFVPIIMGTSIAGASLVGNDALSQELAGGAMDSFGSMGAGDGILMDILSNAGLPMSIIGYVQGAVSNIFSVLSISGVPVLIFLAGLQSIPQPLYEVATVEGSTAYESFWKITLPMISPMVLLCTVYSIIDAFMRHSASINSRSYGVISYMREVAFSRADYGLSAAMTTIYLIVNISVIGLVSFIISRVVFYYD